MKSGGVFVSPLFLFNYKKEKNESVQVNIF